MPPSPTDSQIRARVAQFVEELSGLIREAALEVVQEALGEGGAVSPAPRRGGRKKAGRKKAARRARSSGADVSDAVLAHIKSNPGSRAEEIGAALGANGEDVKRALQGLKASGAVRTHGKARGTSYTAGSGGGAARKTRRKKASRKAGRKRKASRKKGARRKRAAKKTTSKATAAS